MNRRIIATFIALSLIAGLTLWGVGRGVMAKAARAVAPAAPAMLSSLLNPNNFTSLGASPFTQTGTYTINASKDQPSPSLSGPGIVTPISGVFHDPTPADTTNRDEIAVFTFDSISIGAGVSVVGAQNANSRPIALLSKGGTTIDGLVDVSGASGGDGNINTNAGGVGGAAGPGGGGGGGGGGGAGDVADDYSNPSGMGGVGGVGYVAGSNGGDGSLPENFGAGGNGGDVVANGGGNGCGGNCEGSGGAHGGNGGVGLSGGAGGTAYGDLAMTLQGGSGGGGGGSTLIGATGGGGGGGAIEIGAVDSVNLTGSVLANGGAGFFGNRDGGGGAGGGILIHGNTVTLTCSTVSAAGGNGGGDGSFAGGGGGGGRVHIAATTTITTTGALNTRVNVAGGSVGTGFAGGAGVLTTSGTIDILTPLKIDTATLPGGTVGTSYDQTITASDGVQPYTFNVTGGTLPNGVTLNSPGNQLGGTPTAAGSFSFIITARDSRGCAVSQSYTVVINALPTAVADNSSTNEDTPLNVAAPGVLGNDSDPGDTITAVLVSGPSHAASFTPNSNGSFSYTPVAEYHGPDSFSYKARDNHNADSSPVTVSITVNPVNDPPSFASVGNVTVAEDSGAYSASWAASISKGPANDGDQTLTFQVTNNTNPALFSVGPTIAPDGTLSFTPTPNASGDASITVILKDDGSTADGGQDTSAPVTFTITVTPVDDVPTITVAGGGQSLSDNSGRINLLLGDIENSAATLTLSASSSNTQLVSITNITFGGTGANRTATITTGSGRTGQATITINVSDGHSSASTTVTVIVGGNGNDTITGTEGADIIFGNNGDDILIGGGGNDLLCGGRGNDTLTGGLGADSFNGGLGTDKVTDSTPADGDTQDKTVP